MARNQGFIDITKKTKLIRDKNGNVLIINTDGSINVVPADNPGTVDARSVDFIDINPETFTELVKYIIPSGSTFFLKEVCLSLLGFSGFFKIEYYNGTDTELVRHYVLNEKIPSFTELIGNRLSFPYVDAGSYIRVTAKSIWPNHSSTNPMRMGKGFAILNGYS